MVTYERKYKFGEMVIIQSVGGKEQQYKIGIYAGNCLAVFVCDYVNEKGEKMCRLYNFYIDASHARRVKKHCGSLFGSDKVKSIKLNMYFKECSTLLNLFVKDGHKVTAYYKPIK